MQISSSDDACSPATMLVQLALRKWAKGRVKADNISVVVVLFENCKSLGSPAVRCCSEDDELFRSMSSISEMPVQNHKKQIQKTRLTKKSHVRKRKPLTSIGGALHNKCGSVTRRKHKFKIPTTLEQRSAYWSRRKLSQMLENVPLDFDLFAHKSCMQTHCAGSRKVDSFARKYQLALSIAPAI